MSIPAIPAASHFVAMQPMTREEIQDAKDREQLRKDQARIDKFNADLATAKGVTPV